MSLTIVDGLQLMYTNFSGFIFNMFCIVFSSSPFLGGSTIIAVGITFFLFINSSNANSTSPHINSAFFTLFIFAFSFASSMACSTFQCHKPVLQILMQIFLSFQFHNIGRIMCLLCSNLLLLSQYYKVLLLV